MALSCSNSDSLSLDISTFCFKSTEDRCAEFFFSSSCTFSRRISRTFSFSPTLAFNIAFSFIALAKACSSCICVLAKCVAFLSSTNFSFAINEYPVCMSIVKGVLALSFSGFAFALLWSFKIEGVTVLSVSTVSSSD